MKTRPSSAFSLQTLALAFLAALTLFTMALPAPAQWGNALSFDGVDDYVEVPPGPWFGNEFTIETWVYPRAHTTYARILSFTTAGSANGLANSVSLCMSDQETGRPSLHIFDSNGADSPLVSPQPIPLNQWSHVAVTLNADYAVIYINGAPVANGPVTANPVTRNLNYIGRSTYTGSPPIPTSMRSWTTCASGTSPAPPTRSSRPCGIPWPVRNRA